MSQYKKVVVSRSDCGCTKYCVVDVSTGQYVSHPCTFSEANEVIRILSGGAA